jgi:UDP-N-acetyl-D-glucosamine dehydrogenase
MTMAAKVVIVGLGYVGLPLAVRAAEVGYDVTGIDSDDQRVKLLEAAQSYVEDVTSARLHAALGSGRLRATVKPAGAAGFDVCVLAVPTPMRGGTPDLSLIEHAARSVAPHVRRGALVVLESTTYPGTTEDLLRPLLEAGSGLCTPDDFFLGYSPERIDPGNDRWRLENTPKVVAGLEPRSLERVAAFYDRIVQQTVPVSTPRTAELAKLLENTFRQVNVGLVNELATVADRLGVDLWEAIDAAATKPFGFLPFRPGPGVGGHCLPTDPSYLSWQVNRVCGRPLRFVELANEINTTMPAYVVRRVAAGLASRGRPLDGARVLLLGLAYKKNTSDLRESPALEVARLLGTQRATVRAVEPLAPADRIPQEIQLVPLTRRELRRADAVVLLTDHDGFDYSMVLECGRYVFDTRNRCRGSHVERL